MPNRMSDAEMLDQTAEWLSRLAETIERVTERLADSIAKLQGEQDALGAVVVDLAAKHRNLEASFTAHLRNLQAHNPEL